MLGQTTLLAYCFLLLVSITALYYSPANALNIPKKRATTCNGSSDLCNRSYGNITFPGAHDSYAIGTSLATNQNVSITTQLDSGIRMLQSQAHKSSNSTPTGAGIDLCHSYCTLFQGGAIEYWLGQIKNWTDANPNEVVSLLIVNSDGLPPSTFAIAFESVGLSEKMYVPPSATTQKSAWPTLGSMIDSGKTVVAFLATEADYTSVNYLLDEFSNMWENPYDQTTYPFNCSIDRIGQGVTNSSELMYVSNQFLDSGEIILTPDTDAIGTTNSITGTLSTSNECATQHGSYPNFILTDYSTVPNYDLMRAAAQMNGVDYTAPTTSSVSSSGSSTSSAGSSSSTGTNGSSTSSSSMHQPTSAAILLAFVAVGLVASLW